jgi:hypothetical protein
MSNLPPIDFARVFASLALAIGFQIRNAELAQTTNP